MPDELLSELINGYFLPYLLFYVKTLYCRAGNDNGPLKRKKEKKEVKLVYSRLFKGQVLFQPCCSY